MPFVFQQVSVDVKPLRNMDSSLKDSSSSPSDQPESPDLFAMEVKDQESFSLPGRRRTRVQMDMTPLQKKQPARKGRANTRRTKKRKSMEEMEVRWVTENVNVNSAAGLYASFLKGQGHQGIFSLLKGTLNDIISLFTHSPFPPLHF